ncbi:MAG: IS3 family transposase, partial [Chloroflexota bacterium]|nr:IS3 family transposase [Chloroflexota bacterium]
ESFFGTLKTEWTRQRAYQTRTVARTDIFYYIEAFYNRRRLHSALQASTQTCYRTHRSQIGPADSSAADDKPVVPI